MKTLYLIRHGKTSWIQGQSDEQRVLDDSWKEASQKVGFFLKGKNIVLDSIISSPSKRTKETIQLITEEIDFPFSQVEYKQEIYDTHMNGYEWALVCTMELENKYNTVFLIGHNFAISELASYLSDTDIWNMPTCGVIALKFDIKDWSELASKKWEILFSLKPKEL